MTEQLKRQLVITAALGATVLMFAPQSEASGPYSFYSLSPCRVVDTRNSVGPTGGPSVPANSDRAFPVLGACGVPTTAQAVVFNVTIAAPTDTCGSIRQALRCRSPASSTG